MNHYINSVENILYIQQHPNPFIKFGRKCFSQTDEDGFTIEIIRRIIPKNKVYLELGCGNGCENNTLVLETMGWEGQWIGNEDLPIKHYNYTKAFITKENVLDLINVNPSVLSVDLDGNDYHILKEILTKHSPDIIITEYNAKFPPPSIFVQKYNANHVWDGSDYFGASLQAFINLLKDYKLVVCNPTTGANAFFVKQEYKAMFPEVPLIPRDIYVPPRYTAITYVDMHKPSYEIINHILLNEIP